MKGEVNENNLQNDLKVFYESEHETWKRMKVPESFFSNYNWIQFGLSHFVDVKLGQDLQVLG